MASILKICKTEKDSPIEKIKELLSVADLVSKQTISKKKKKSKSKKRKLEEVEAGEESAKDDASSAEPSQA